MTANIRRKKLSLVFQEQSGDLLEAIQQPAGTLAYSGRDGLPSRASGPDRDRKSSSIDRRDSPPDSAFPPYRIMVVDDEPDAVSVLKKGLEQKGFSVVGYTNPVEALSNFARHRYDIVLTDIRMPQMNGLDLFKQLRAIDGEVLICFVTAYEQFRRDFEIDHPEERASCFIPKPIMIDRLVSTITRKMEEKES